MINEGWALREQFELYQDVTIQEALRGENAECLLGSSEVVDQIDPE